MPPPSLSLTTLLNAFREDVDEPVAAVLLYERQIPVDGKDKGLLLFLSGYGSTESSSRSQAHRRARRGDQDSALH